MKKQPKLMTLEQAANSMGISKGALATMVHLGRIPYMKMGRGLYFTRELLDEWVKQQVTMPMPSKDDQAHKS